MNDLTFLKKIKEGTVLILKCVGMALAVAAFVCSVLGTMPTEEAVKIVSLAVACLGVAILADIRKPNE